LPSRIESQKTVQSAESIGGMAKTVPNKKQDSSKAVVFFHCMTTYDINLKEILKVV